MALQAIARTPTTGRLRHIVASLAADFVAWREERAMRRALSRLTDRELTDIGLVRGDLDESVHREMQDC